MTPEYLRELADFADPDTLWRHSGFDQLDLPPEKRRHLDTGVALRRHAADLERLIEAYAKGKSVLLTPLSPTANSRDVRMVKPPAAIVKRRGGLRL